MTGSIVMNGFDFLLDKSKFLFFLRFSMVKGLCCDSKLCQSFSHVVNRVESPRAVVTNEHGSATVVALSQDLGTTATAALSI